MIKFIPYEKHIFRSPHQNDDIVNLINKKLRPPLKGFHIWPYQSYDPTKPYEGYISCDKFKIMRIVYDRSEMSLPIRGKIKDDHQGSEIQIIIMPPFILGLILMIILSMSISMLIMKFSFILLMLIFAIYNFFLFMFKLSAKKSKKFFQELLDVDKYVPLDQIIPDSLYD